MAFIDDATENLTPAELYNMQDLSALVAAFESTPDQDKVLAYLKAKVYTAVATRERTKQLAFLTTKAFSAEDVLRTAGYSRKEIMQAVEAIFPKGSASISEPIATYPSANGPMHYKDGERLSKELKKAIAAGGFEGFVANLTDFGKEHLAITKVITKGPNAGTAVYQNLIDISKRLKFREEDEVGKAAIRGVIGHAGFPSPSGDAILRRQIEEPKSI